MDETTRKRMMDALNNTPDNVTSPAEWDAIVTLPRLTVRQARLTVRQALAGEFGSDDGKHGWRKMIDHVAEVVNTYRTDYRDRLVFSTWLVGARDVHGYDDPMSVSNFRRLSDDWSDFDIHTDTWSNIYSIGLGLDDPAPDDLVSVVSALMDYPVLDESLWSYVESEMIDEHWVSYGRHDAEIALARALGVDASDLTDHAVSVLDELTFSGGNYGITDNYPTFIDVSAVDFHTDDVVAWIVANAGDTVNVSRWNDDPYVIDLTLGALVAS